MKTKNTIIATLLVLAAAMPAQAHESKHKLEYPGFRPMTEQATTFAQNVVSSKIAVFPSIVRRVSRCLDRDARQRFPLGSWIFQFLKIRLVLFGLQAGAVEGGEVFETVFPLHVMVRRIGGKG
jgi:hypothetical protein